MSTTTAIKATLVYEDASTRNYTINDIGTLDVDSVKAAVRGFNDVAATENSVLKQTFISDDGAPVTMMKDVRIVTTEEEVIYNG